VIREELKGFFRIFLYFALKAVSIKSAGFAGVFQAEKFWGLCKAKCAPSSVLGFPFISCSPFAASFETRFARTSKLFLRLQG